MIDSDSDKMGNLLKDVDIDDMDDELFGRKKDGKHGPARKGLSAIDDLFGEPQKEKKSKKNFDDFFATKKPTVSFLDEVGNSDLQEHEQTTITSSKKEPSLDNKGKPHPTKALRTSFDMEDIFGATPKRDVNLRAAKPIKSDFMYGTTMSTAGESERSYNSSRPEASQKNSSISQQLEIPGYDRMQRLENEIDRLNREIDALKHMHSESEKTLIEEWKEKLKRKDQQHEKELADLEESQRKQLNRLKNDHEEVLQSFREMLRKQMESILEGQNETRNYEEMFKKADSLVANISEIKTNLINQVEKSNADKSHYISFREQKLEIREERLKKEEEWLAEEKRHIRDLNLKLQSLYETSEQKVLQEKWQVREERQKLNAEMEAFKNEQMRILDATEQQKIDIESSKSSFLRQQHDLIIRVIAAQSSLEAEKSAFVAQRDGDVARLKMEAEQLEQKLKQVQNAEDVLRETQRIYEQKYQQIVALEKALIEECFELERCRKQLETIPGNVKKETDFKGGHDQQMVRSTEINAPDFVLDPYTDEQSSLRGKESYDAVMRMHAEALSANSLRNLDIHA